MNKSNLEDWANWVGIPGVALYVCSMLIYPWVEGQGSWAHVHEVWDKWQTFNAAALAFLASLIALNLSRIKDEKQRERDFLASKAFLPSAFSELSVYFKSSASILAHIWESGVAGIVAPTPPSAYRDAFKDCIRHATPEGGEHLTAILVKLQIHEARLGDAARSASAADKYALISYLFALGELKVLVDKQYEFARGEAPFDGIPASWDDFKNAYGILDLHLEDYEVDEKWTLKAVTQRALERRDKQDQ